MRIVLSLILIVSLTGCGLELLTATAIGAKAETDSMKTAVKALNHAKGTQSEIELQHAINAYSAEMGKYPPSLNALVPEWLPSIPAKPDGSAYGYDPSTGKVLDRPLPAPPVPVESDAQKMARIRAAINQYGQATQFYPRTLQDLTPDYLATVPKTAGGQDFLYDMQTGAVYHPNPQAMTQPAPHAGNPNTPARPRGGAAGGPMGEVMTGIAIQQDLNNMSSAGSSAAGSRMRQRARNLNQNGDARANQTMNELGL